MEDPGGFGRIASKDVRFETWKPFTCSTGWEAHQATKPDESEASLRIFQSAFTFRKRLVIGTRLPVASSIARKSAIPWMSGPTPVTIVVQSRGEIIGSYERSGARTPLAIRRARFGS